MLRSGDKFGDLCFYKSKNERNATVIADENLHLLVVDCKVYQILLADKFLDMMDQLRFMEKSPLFKGMYITRAFILAVSYILMLRA